MKRISAALAVAALAVAAAPAAADPGAPGTTFQEQPGAHTSRAPLCCPTRAQRPRRSPRRQRRLRPA
jgi:hypothetical protein